MDQNQQNQPQDYQLRNRPEPGQRPNRTPAGSEMNLAANNRTQAPERQGEEEETPPPEKGTMKKILPFLIPIGGTAASMWGIFKFLS